MLEEQKNNHNNKVSYTMIKVQKYLSSPSLLLLLLLLGLASCASSKYDQQPEYVEGYAVVSLKGRYGMIDRAGAEIIAPKYDYLTNFANGSAKFTLGGKSGLVDKLGKEIVPAKYEKIGAFSRGIAKVVLHGKTGFIDEQGKEVLEVKYDAADYHIIGKHFNVVLNGKPDKVKSPIAL